MESDPSRSLLGVAEEIVEVDDISEIKAVIGDPNAPNKDTNTQSGAVKSSRKLSDAITLSIFF